MEINKLMVICAAAMMVSACETNVKPSVGDVCKGDFVGGIECRDGKIKVTDPDGIVYKGFVDEPHGKVKMADSNGNVYEMDLVNGEPNGKVKVTRSDGTVLVLVLEGDFMNGGARGKIKMTRPNGTVIEGEFVNGEQR